MKKNKLRVLFCVSGKGRLFRAAVLEQKRLNIEPVMLVAGENSDPSLKNFCLKHEISYARLNFRDKSIWVQKAGPLFCVSQAALFVLTMDSILPSWLVKRYEGQILNIHPGLLPSFKGLGAIQAAIKSGVKFAGASIHEVTPKVDEGALLAQCVVAVEPKETKESLGKKIYRRLRPMFLQSLAWYAEGRVRKDKKGKLWVRGADYEDGFFCPRIEISFPNDN